MRRIVLAIFGSSLFVVSTFAQTTVEAYFVKGSGTKPSKVIFPATGLSAPVLTGDYSATPQECPEGSFWVSNNVALVSCSGGGAMFKFVTGAVPPGSPYGEAIALKKIGDQPGTDKPPPMKREPPSNGEVKQ